MRTKGSGAALAVVGSFVRRQGLRVLSNLSCSCSEAPAAQAPWHPKLKPYTPSLNPKLQTLHPKP